MKRQLFILGISIASLAGCTKLNQTPPDQLSTTVFWKQASDADLALTGIYGTLYAGSGGVDQYGPMWWDNFSDNSYSQHSLAGAQESLISGLTPTSNGFPNTTYSSSYKTISAVNNFLPNVNKVLSGDQLKKYRGEALFIRGLSYWYLAMTYGNVPLILDDPFTIDYSSSKAKSPRADVLKQVELDWDSAIAYLPDAKFTNGHVTKAAAEGYMTRLYMYEKRWPEAAAMSKSIIDGQLFSLNANYASNFYKPDQSSSPEIMFSVQFKQPAVPHSYSLNVLLIGPGWKDVQGTQDMINEYEPNDPRKTMTFFLPGDGVAQGWPYPGTIGTPGVAEWVSGYYPTKKFVDPTVKDPVPGLLDDQDYVLLRYADVKLMYAEAQNEATGPDASVYQQVNDVRARPGVNMPALPAGLSQADMRQHIWHERRVELALEGLRYFDLRRWGIAKQKLNGFVQNPLQPTLTTIYKDNYEFWPIPQQEIDINKPTLVQNDGY